MGVGETGLDGGFDVASSGKDVGIGRHRSDGASTLPVVTIKVVAVVASADLIANLLNLLVPSEKGSGEARIR